MTLSLKTQGLFPGSWDYVKGWVPDKHIDTFITHNTSHYKDAICEAYPYIDHLRELIFIIKSQR